MFKKFGALLIYGVVALFVGLAIQGCASLGDGGYYGPSHSEYNRIGVLDNIGDISPPDTP